MKVFKVWFKTGNICFVEGVNVLTALVKNNVKNEGIVRYKEFDKWDDVSV